jgi:hypothetical protein
MPPSTVETNRHKQPPGGYGERRPLEMDPTHSVSDDGRSEQSRLCELHRSSNADAVFDNGRC